jgi:hypothetical protein
MPVLAPVMRTVLVGVGMVGLSFRVGVAPRRTRRAGIGRGAIGWCAVRDGLVAQWR